MGFFYFSIHTSRGQVPIGQVPRAAIIPAPPTQRTERPIKLPKKDATAKVYGPFFIFILRFFLLIFVFFASSIHYLINILNMQPVEETDRKTRAQMAQEKSRAGK